MRKKPYRRVMNARIAAGLIGVLLFGVTTIHAEPREPIPIGIQFPLARVTARLSLIPFETIGSEGGGIRRHAQDAPCDTVVAVYPNPSAPPNMLKWTREQIDVGRCPAGQRGVTLWTFTARRESPAHAPRAWEAYQLQTCLDPVHPAPPVLIVVSTENSAVRKVAAEILQRLAK